MNRYIVPILLTLLLVVACGKEDDSFVIKGKLNNLGGHPLYAIYEHPDGFAIDTLMPENGKFEMRGVAHNAYTPVQLYDYAWQPYMRLYMNNGERVELEGDAQAKYEIKMKGPHINRDLWKLICKNNDIFTAAYTSGYNLERGMEKEDTYNHHTARLDSLLINYIEHHHNNKLSSVLIGDYLLRYDNFAFCDSLWQELSDDAQLPIIATTMNRLRDELRFNGDNNKLPHLRYLNDKDSLDFVNPRDSKATLLCIWTADNRQASAWRKELAQYAEQYDKEKLQVVALSFDRDTAIWHQAIDNDTTAIVDMWGDAIYTSKQLKKHNVTRMPVYMLADSVGNILVRTSSLPDSDVDTQLDSLLTRNKYSIEHPIFKP